MFLLIRTSNHSTFECQLTQVEDPVTIIHTITFRRIISPLFAHAFIAKEVLEGHLSGTKLWWTHSTTALIIMLITGWSFLYWTLLTKSNINFWQNSLSHMFVLLPPTAFCPLTQKTWIKPWSLKFVHAVSSCKNSLASVKFIRKLLP